MKTKTLDIRKKICGRCWEDENRDKGIPMYHDSFEHFWKDHIEEISENDLCSDCEYKLEHLMSEK